MFDIALETSATVNPAYTPSKFSWLLNLHVRCSGDAAVFKSDTSRLKHRMEQNFEKMAQKRPNQTASQKEIDLFRNSYHICCGP